MKHDPGALEAGWKKESLDLRYFGRLLWRQFVPLVLVPILCVLGGIAYAVLATPIYSASALLSVDVGSAPSDTLNATLVSHMEAIRSNDVTSEVIERLDLANGVTVEVGKLEQAIAAVREELGIDAREEMSEEEIRTLIANSVASALAVERAGDSAIIRLTYFAGTPQHAAEVANAYADIYVTGLVDRSVEHTERRAKFLRSRVEETKQLAASSYKEVQEIRSQDGFELEDFEDLDARVAWLREARSEIEQAEIALEAHLSLMQNTDDLEGLELAASQVEGGPDLYYAYRDALANLVKLRGNEAAQGYLSQLEATVSQLRRDLDQAINRKRMSLEQELAILTARRESVDRQFENDLLQSNIENWSKILIAEHQAGVFQNIYADHLRELENVYGRAGDVPIRVMTHARPSVEPSSPDYKLILVVSAVVGLALGAAIAMLREWQASHGAFAIGHPEEVGR